jgi:branched-chain amino acid transport system substrate-binding protein
MMFLAAFGDNVQAAAGAEYALDTFGDSAYLLWDKGQTYTTLLAEYFKARFTEAGGTLVAEDTYESDATDFAAQIAKIKALPEQPAFYYVAAMPGNIGIVVKQMRDAGLTGPIIGGDGYDTPDLPAIAGPASNDVYFTTHALMDANGGTEPIKAFMAAYEAKFGHPVENAFAALGYDTVYLLKDAIERAGSMDGQALKGAIETTADFPGITGSITFSPDSHVPQKGVTVIEVVDQAFTLAAEVVPTSVPAP